jgi:hypothetical protein
MRFYENPDNRPIIEAEVNEFWEIFPSGPKKIEKLQKIK